MTLVSDPPDAAAAAARAAAVPGIEERVIEATLACIGRHGLSKTTIDDIARQAGCSRATLYRYFGGKRDLVERVVRAESDRVLGECCAAADAETTLEDAAHAMFVTAGSELTRHAALRFVADFEPEILLPHLTFSGGDRFLRTVADALAPSLERFVGERADRAAEWMARLGLALWLSPTAPVSLADDDALRAYVHEFVAPALRPVSDQIVPSQAVANL